MPQIHIFIHLLIQVDATFQKKMDGSLYFHLKNRCNPDCLVRIFEKLTSVDLQQICDLDTEKDQFFTDLVYFDVIGKKLVCASSWGDDKAWSIGKALRIFGGKITKLKIKTAPMFIENFIRLFTEHNGVDTLRELQIELRNRNIRGNQSIMSHQFMTAAIPHFRRLEVLKLYDNTKEGSESLECFLSAIVNHAHNLRFLSLRGVCVWRLHQSLVANRYGVRVLELFEMEFMGRSVGQRQRIQRFLQKFACVSLLICDRRSFDLYQSIIVEMQRQGFGLVCGEITEGKNFAVDINNVTVISITAIEHTGSDIRDTLEMVAANKQPLNTLRISFVGSKWTSFEGEPVFFPPINYLENFSRLNTVVLNGNNFRINANAVGVFTQHILRPMRGLKSLKFSSLRYCDTIIHHLYELPSMLNFQDADLDETEIMLIVQAIHNCGHGSDPTIVSIAPHHVEYFEKYWNNKILITVL